MQFHLNGFRPGDPSIHPAEPPRGSDGEVDVLIVGCGPAGLTLAAQLAAFPDIRTKIIEQKSGPLELGQADGIACRTMEMFAAFGFVDRVMCEAYWVNEIAFWKPDRAGGHGIVRSHRVQDVEDGLSEFPHVILNQARVHDFYLAVMRDAPTRLEPDYNRRLIDLSMPPDDPKAPVAVRLERLNSPGEELLRARYVVGCDGARSAVRRAMGLSLSGDSANQAWGVMDVLAVTDFPDVRLKAVIQSPGDGNALIIPREGGYLFRIYIELDKLGHNERVASRNITSDYLVGAAQRILRPYRLEVKEIAWWSVYEIGQRLCDRFDDLTDAADERAIPRVFIAGDACHTHSPKAGQGMNVSMQDGFNLGWKLAAVLRGQADPVLLRTYSAERQAVAQELIDFDRKLAALFSAPPKDPADPNGVGVDPAELQAYLAQQLRFTAGTETQYRPSMICGTLNYQALAQGFLPGRRFHSAPVIRVADARAIQLGHAGRADGRWRLYLFAPDDNPAAANSRIHGLCDFLAGAPHGPILRYVHEGDDINSVLDVRAVFQQDYRTLDLTSMPPLLWPRKGKFALHDYEKIFCADRTSGRDIFDLRGISRTDGCVVIVRPDQYVAHVLPFDAHEAIGGFFEGFLLPAW